MTSARGKSELTPELINSVRVYRTRAADLSSFGLVGRACEYAKFYMAATQLLRRVVRPGDILVAKTDPPLISVVAAFIAKRRGAILINWLQDLYPEVAAGLHVPLVRGPIFSLLRQSRDYALRSAHINVAIGGQMAEVLRGRGINADRIAIMPNWLDDRKISPVATKDNELLKRMDLQGKFVIGYCGSLGRAHEYGTLLGAARLLAHEENLIFMFIANGYQVKSLKEKGRGGRTSRSLSVFATATNFRVKLCSVGAERPLDLTTPGDGRFDRSEQVLRCACGRSADASGDVQNR